MVFPDPNKKRLSDEERLILGFYKRSSAKIVEAAVHGNDPAAISVRQKQILTEERLAVQFYNETTPLILKAAMRGSDPAALFIDEKQTLAEERQILRFYNEASSPILKAAIIGNDPAAVFVQAVRTYDGMETNAPWAQGEYKKLMYRAARNGLLTACHFLKCQS